VDTILLSVAPYPTDSDNNRYADTIMVTVYLFPDPVRHALPIHAAGSFRFRLTDPDGATLAEWHIPPEEVDRARVRTPPGPGYCLSLNINDVASDRVSVRSGSLTCTFEPLDGSEPVSVRGQSTVQIGPTGSVMGKSGQPRQMFVP